jgi:hypothetical protein
MEPSPPTVYLSYRATDTDREVDQLRHSLEARAGAASAQLGVAGLGAGAASADVAQHLAALARSAVVLVVVGPKWAEARNANGASALADPADPVRQELLDAIERRLPMLVVLVRGARMVRAADVPAELTAVAQRPSVEIHPSRWEFDVAALVELVKPLLGTRRAIAEPATARRAVVAPDAAQVLRDRAARLAPRASGAGSGASRSLPWLAAIVACFGLAGAGAWWWTGDRPAVAGSPAPSWASSPASLPPPAATAADRLAALRADATVASAVAQAAARAAEAAAAAIPSSTDAQERERWRAEVQRLRDEARAAQEQAATLARRVVEAEAAERAVPRPADPAPLPAAPATLPSDPPPRPTAPSPSPPVAELRPAPAAAPAEAAPAIATRPATSTAAAAAPVSAPPQDVQASPARLSLANWAIATSSGCGAGELRAVGTNEVTITRTAQGILVSQTFQGTAGPWRLGTSGSAVFDAPRPSYEIESSGLWTRDGSQPFRSISRLTITTRDGGLVPAGARGSQYRTECPGG